MPLTSCGSKVYSNDAEMCKRGNRNRLSGQTTWNGIKTMKNHVDQPEECCIDLKNLQHRKRSLILNDYNGFFSLKYPQSSIKCTCHNLLCDEFNFLYAKTIG